LTVPAPLVTPIMLLISETSITWCYSSTAKWGFQDFCSWNDGNEHCNKQLTIHDISNKVTNMFEDTKGVIRSRKSKDRQNNGQAKEDKRTNNVLQNVTQKTKDRATRTSLKTTGMNSGAPEGWKVYLLNLFNVLYLL
jgi:hypothetical protein